MKYRVHKQSGYWCVDLPTFGFGNRTVTFDRHDQALAWTIRQIDLRNTAHSLSSTTGHEVWGPWTSKKPRL